MKITRYLTVISFLTMAICSVVGQDNMTYPVNLGSKSFSFSYTDTKNTEYFNNDFYGQGTKDVYYKFTITQPMNVFVNLCGSEVSDTYVSLLNEAGELIAENDDDEYNEYCENTQQSCITIYSLSAGTYYVVSEGHYENGNITTTIQGIFPIAANSTNWSNPINLGEKSASFEYTDTKNTALYPNDYTGQSSNDVFYKFTLLYTMDVTINNCGSSLADTYLHLLDSKGGRIAYCDDYYGTDKCTNSLNAYIKYNNLPAGTYYVVSEGYSGNGNITTTIKGVCNIAPVNLYDGSAVFGTANSTRNFIQTITPTIATNNVTSLGVDQSLQTIQYFDGLGRPIQTVQRGITPGKQDLATYTEYDGAGREWKQYLPVTSAGNGAFVDYSAFNSASGIYAAEGRPFTETIYEASPLNRVLGAKKPGNAWSTHPSAIDYNGNDTIIPYFYVDNSTQKLKRGTPYDTYTLYKTTVADEDGKTSTEFKDKLGQVVLKCSASNVYTYYVYNDLGQLAYVLPPLAYDHLFETTVAGSIIEESNAELLKYAYLYKYDDRGNCTAKRLPGCDWIYMVYDRADRLILSQDGNQRPTNQWTVNKYDVFGRVLYTGLTTETTSHANLITDLADEVITESWDTNMDFNDIGYTCGRFTPTSLLTVNYYDNYDFVAQTSSGLGYDNSQETTYGEKYTSAKGLLTGSRIYLLDNSGSYTASAMYYDYRGRVVQTRSTNYMSGFDIVYSSYNFTGHVIKNQKDHSCPGKSPISELTTFDYDHAGRMLSTSYSLNGTDPVVLATYTYDELGRLVIKNRHNGVEKGTFNYNIQNWIQQLKSGEFYEIIDYEKNGNISSVGWESISHDYYANGTEFGWLRYSYTYDDLNRLLTTDLQVSNQHILATFLTGSGNESFDYDKMGNITHLLRIDMRGSESDNLEYTYNGNQVTSIYDMGGGSNEYDVKEYQNRANTSNEMAYDANGNLIKDLDRNIYTIRYNVLNLPDVIQFNNGNQIKNLYDAAGSKLRTEYYTQITNLPTPINPGDICNLSYTSGVTDQNGVIYDGNIEYETKNGNLSLITLSRIYNNEGYVENLTNPQFYYFVKDHIGNNRRVWLGNKNMTVQNTEYYASGLPWVYMYDDNPSLQNRKYNGKEFVEMHGLDEYDSQARNYYPAIGRTLTVDPLAEKYYSISPYAWCGGNPVRKIDENGMYYYDWDKKVYRTDGGAEVSWEEVKGNNFIEPSKLEFLSLNSDKRSINIDNFLKENAPQIWDGVVNGRIEDIMLKKIDVGTNWVDGMPTMINKNGKILVVSAESGKYIELSDESLVKRFDDIYYQKNKLYRTGKEISLVADTRFVESFLAAYASDANPNPLSKINLFGSYIDGINYYNSVATKNLNLKRIYLYKKYNLIK